MVHLNNQGTQDEPAHPHTPSERALKWKHLPPVLAGTSCQESGVSTTSPCVLLWPQLQLLLSKKNIFPTHSLPHNKNQSWDKGRGFRIQNRGAGVCYRAVCGVNVVCSGVFSVCPHIQVKPLMYSGYSSDEARVSNICSASPITKDVLCDRRFGGRTH